MLRAPVGDKYVLEWMRKHSASLGGEQSGHILFPALLVPLAMDFLPLWLCWTSFADRGRALDELTADLARSLSSSDRERQSEGKAAAQ